MTRGDELDAYLAVHEYENEVLVDIVGREIVCDRVLVVVDPNMNSPLLKK